MSNFPSFFSIYVYSIIGLIQAVNAKTTDVFRNIPGKILQRKRHQNLDSKKNIGSHTGTSRSFLTPNFRF